MLGLVQHHSSAHSLLSLPFPEGLIGHKPTTLFVQHTGFIQTKGTASPSRISALLRHQQTRNCITPNEHHCCFI